MSINWNFTRLYFFVQIYQLLPFLARRTPVPTDKPTIVFFLPSGNGEIDSATVKLKMYKVDTEVVKLNTDKKTKNHTDFILAKFKKQVFVKYLIFSVLS